MHIRNLASYESIIRKDAKFPGELVVESSCVSEMMATYDENMEMEILLSKLLLVVSKQINTKVITFVDAHGNYFRIQRALGKVEVDINSANMFGLLVKRLFYLPTDYNIYILRVNEVRSSDVDFIEQLLDRTMITILYRLPLSKEILIRLNLLRIEMGYRNFNYDQISN